MTHQRHNVLVIEDEEESGLLVETALKTLERKVRINWITTAEEAEELLKSGKKFDLIISDHFLEGEETGLELWRACQKNYNHIPFILTSALNSQQFNGMMANENEHPLFLQKPFLIEECKEILEWFWDDESSLLVDEAVVHTPQTTNFRFNLNYKLASMALLGLLTLFTSTEVGYFHRERGATVQFPPALRYKIGAIEIRAEDILQSFQLNYDPLKNSLPIVPSHFNFDHSYDGKFEKYGRLIRVG